VDDCTRYVWMYPRVRKYDALSVFMALKKMVENLFSRTIKIIQFDWGGGFMSKSFTAFLQHHCIVHHISCPHTPQQNGVVEQKHWNIVEMGLCLLSQILSTIWFLDGRLLHCNIPHQQITHGTTSTSFPI
jgi:transposase InsO family protein